MTSPCEIEDFQWWANDISKNMYDSVSRSILQKQSQAEKNEIQKMVKQIAKEITGHTNREALSYLVDEAREKIKIVEESCLNQLYDGFNGTTDDSPNTKNGSNSSTEREMAEALTKIIPEQLSKFIATEIFKKLISDDFEEENSSEDEFGETNERLWKKAASSFYIPEEKSGETQEELERKFYLIDDRNQRIDAFRKFRMVLANGNGFRVIKHNHNGGKSTRILKYNAEKNWIVWESSRVIAGERVCMSRIVKLHREENTVYIWHMAGGRHGSEKKMVGFETQREADARILELAILYFMDHYGTHKGKVK
mmetsp:Transcript_7709/g.11607  ORF Transcript_7709/g.11607 Transcript_7709/m.11607 type:complete len:310 (+) Transcript_7709:29-958(+)